MKFPFKFVKAKDKSTDFLTLDIGSSSLKFCLFSVSEDKKLNLERFFEAPLPVGMVSEGIINNVEKLANHVKPILANELNENQKLLPVIAGLSGNSIFGFTTTVRLKRQKPESKISVGELKNFIKKIQEVSYIEGTNFITRKTGQAQDIEIVNSSVTYCNIDGENTNNIQGKSGENLEIALFTSFSPKGVLNSTIDLCKKLGLKFTTATQSHFSVCKFLTELNSGGLNAITLDIGAETTDVGIIFGGSLIATRTLDLGGLNVTKALTKQFNIDHNEAEKMKLEAYDGTVDSEERKALKNAVASLWLLGLETLLGDFDGVKIFPSFMFLLGGGAKMTEFSSIIEQQKSWYKDLSFKSTPKAEVLLLSECTLINDKNAILNNPKAFTSVSLGLVGLELSN